MFFFNLHRVNLNYFPFSVGLILSFSKGTFIIQNIDEL